MSTLCTTLKMAVFAPIPSASVAIITAVKPGRAQSVRSPNCRSCATDRTILDP